MKQIKRSRKKPNRTAVGSDLRGRDASLPEKAKVWALDPTPTSAKAALHIACFRY